MSSEIRDVAKTAAYWLRDAAKSVDCARKCAVPVKDGALHAKIETAAKAVQVGVDHVTNALADGRYES